VNFERMGVQKDHPNKKNNKYYKIYITIYIIKNAL